MEIEDLQIIEDFNEQSIEIAEKTKKLVNYLKECMQLDTLNEWVENAQKGIENFDIYTFIDFIEIEQAETLASSVEVFISRLTKLPSLTPEQEHFLKQAEYYVSICQSRVLFLKTIDEDPQQNKYTLLYKEEIATTKAETATGSTSAEQEQTVPFVLQKLSKMLTQTK